jgi:sulfite reductase alpha subunit-like flavoprotein
VHGSTLEITFDTGKVGMTYKTATNLAIFPTNSQEDIEETAKILGFNLKQRFCFINNPLS